MKKNIDKKEEIYIYRRLNVTGAKICDFDDGRYARRRNLKGAVRCGLSPLLARGWFRAAFILSLVVSNKRPQVSQHFAFSRTLRSAFARGHARIREKDGRMHGGDGQNAQGVQGEGEAWRDLFWWLKTKSKEEKAARMEMVRAVTALYT